MKNTVETLIKEFVSNYPKSNNVLSRWQDPLVAFAKVEDPMFTQLKQWVSPTHALPKDLLENAKTVITYFIPFDNSINQSNIAGKNCSREWAISYIETNQLLLDLNYYIHEELNKLGYDTTLIPATHNFDEKILISDWSHRHIAYIAGLGKFGINNMLITDQGCCGRIGSIVTDLKIEPTKRLEKEFCLYKEKGICNKCVSRCVNDALTLDGFDRHKCYEMCLQNDKLYADLGLCDVCGKCLVNLPCSTRNPSD